MGLTAVLGPSSTTQAGDRPPPQLAEDTDKLSYADLLQDEHLLSKVGPNTKWLLVASALWGHNGSPPSVCLACEVQVLQDA